MGFDLKNYEEVKDRIPRFWEKHPEGAIETDMVEHQGDNYVVKATLRRTEGGPVLATGLAQETVGVGNVNKTAALENCETSAIGRALANAGFSSTKSARPSREEMSKVNGSAPEAGDIDSMKPRELAQALSAAGLEVAGTVDEMKDRLRAAVAA